MTELNEREQDVADAYKDGLVKNFQDRCMAFVDEKYEPSPELRKHVLAKTIELQNQVEREYRDSKQKPYPEDLVSDKINAEFEKVYTAAFAEWCLNIPFED